MDDDNLTLEMLKKSRDSINDVPTVLKPFDYSNIENHEAYSKYKEKCSAELDKLIEDMD